MRNAIGKEDVFAACEALLNAGQDVSVRLVRQEIGAGSYTTIAPFVENWKKQRAVELNEREGLKIPELSNEIKASFDQALLGLWERAHLHAHTEVKKLSAEFQVRMNELEKELKQKTDDLLDTLQETKRIEDQNKELEVALSEQKRLVSEKEGQIQLLKLQLKDSERELKSSIEALAKAQSKSDSKTRA